MPASTEGTMSEVLTGTITGLLVGVITWAVRSAMARRAERSSGRLHQRVEVFEPSEGVINEGFYRYFCEQIDQAVEEIVVTGEGIDFNLLARNAERSAEAYHASLRDALSRGVSVTRIQSANPFHPRWAQMQAELIDRFPETFHLYVMDNREHHEVASVCVIDADLDRCLAEYMLPAERDVNNQTGRLASTAVFIHGYPRLARAMRRNVLTARDYEMTRYCRTREDLGRWLPARPEA